MKKVLRKATMAMAIVLATGSAAAEPTILLDVDFSEKCTAGSESEPQMYRFSSDFTKDFTGWSLSSASAIGQAGGSLYISDGATVRTPYLSGVSTSNGAIKVTLEVKLRNTDMGMAQLKWGYSTSFSSEIYTGDWTTLEYVIVPTSASSYSNYANIGPYLSADGMFLKSVKIEQGKEFIGAPTAYLPSDANGTSFTARWKAVSGADKYYIDVYSYAADGSKVMFLENKEVTPTTATASYIYYEVKDLDPKTTYYYVVRAANADAVSSPSEEIEVVKVVSSLDAPVVKVDAAADGAYTATWDAVADATGYVVDVTASTVMTEAGLADVLSESFDCFTTGTPESYEYAYDRHLAMLGEPGWTGSSLLYYNGGMGFAPFGSETYLETPALDLSGNGGKVTVMITGAARKGLSYVAGQSLSLMLEDKDGNLTAPVVMTFAETGFDTYSVELEGGTASSKVKIVDDNEDTSVRYFLDDIKVQQVKPAGYVNTVTYASAEVDTNSYKGSVEVKENTTYHIVVTAFAPTVDGGSVTYVYSEPSEKVAIATSAGVDSIAGDNADGVSFKSLGNGVVEVTADAAATVEIYDIAGRKLAAVNVVAGTTTLSVNAKGVVIVKAGSKVAKLVI